MLRAIASLSILLTISLLSSRAAADAELQTFSLPVLCGFSDECYIQSHVDLDPSPSTADHACGINTYNGHKGTDFRLRNLDLMDRGVPVVAAAAGTVIRKRDGNDEINIGRAAFLAPDIMTSPLRGKPPSITSLSKATL